MHLMVTDLPVPEPPMITIEDCLSMVRSTPSSTTLGPKRFLTPISSIFGVERGRSFVEQERGQHIVGGQDEDRGRHHRIGGGVAHALRAALGIEAVVAAHQGDDEAEHRRLDQAAR